MDLTMSLAAEIPHQEHWQALVDGQWVDVDAVRIVVTRTDGMTTSTQAVYVREHTDTDTDAGEQRP